MGAVCADMGMRRGPPLQRLQRAEQHGRTPFYPPSLGFITAAASLSIFLHLLPSLSHPLVSVCPAGRFAEALRALLREIS